MSRSEERRVAPSGRREPPPFRMVTLLHKKQLSDRMIRVTLTGEDLRGLEVDEPAASVRLLLPPPGQTELVMPRWNGNEFLMEDGSRPAIRTFTPRRLDQAGLQLDIDMVIHDGGLASEWATSAAVGYPAAVSGPGRGFRASGDVPAFVLGGDETAIPAISQLLETIDPIKAIQVHVEIAVRQARLSLPGHPQATVDWHVLGPEAPPGRALVAALEHAEFPADAHIWCAGEAASMHAIRNHLFKERGLPRSQATVRGYWKAGR
jgi:NADPH-dependent ferric siderophore reductase